MLIELNTLSSSVLLSPADSTVSTDTDSEGFGSLTVRPGSSTPYTDATNCKKSKKHIVRPMNAFILWSQIERRKITQVRPNIHNAEISKQLGQLWKTLSQDQRQPYMDEAERLRVLHSKEYPDYKYKPKKRLKSKSQTKLSSNKPSNKTQKPVKCIKPKRCKTILKSDNCEKVENISNISAGNVITLVYSKNSLLINNNIKTNAVLKPLTSPNLGLLCFKAKNNANTSIVHNSKGIEAQLLEFIDGKCEQNNIKTNLTQNIFDIAADEDLINNNNRISPWVFPDFDDVSMFRDDDVVHTSLLEQQPALEWKNLFEELDISTIDIDTNICIESETNSETSLQNMEMDSDLPDYFTPEVAEIIATDWLRTSLGSIV